MSEEATTNPTPMRLRAEPPRVTRLSRKMLAGAGAVALLGIGGALIYALQTRDMSGNGEELYSTENRATADGLAGLPKDYTGPVLGPALPGDLGGPILDGSPLLGDRDGTSRWYLPELTLVVPPPGQDPDTSPFRYDLVTVGHQVDGSPGLEATVTVTLAAGPSAAR